MYSESESLTLTSDAETLIDASVLAWALLSCSGVTGLWLKGSQAFAHSCLPDPFTMTCADSDLALFGGDRFFCSDLPRDRDLCLCAGLDFVFPPPLPLRLSQASVWFSPLSQLLQQKGLGQWDDHLAPHVILLHMRSISYGSLFTRRSDIAV